MILWRNKLYNWKIVFKRNRGEEINIKKSHKQLTAKTVSDKKLREKAKIRKSIFREGGVLMITWKLQRDKITSKSQSIW